jgi:colanic acid biosynthesis glycosyl transferase WcaI
MRVLLITQWFNPEPTFKGLAFARELKRLGHEVEVLTGFPNYPGGKIYQGYRVRACQEEIIDGIRILRVALYPSHDNSAIRRVCNYLSFAFSAAVIGAFKVKKPDVIYVYHPPATIGLPALFIRTLYRRPFVLDIQDLWPDTLAATGMFANKAAYWLVSKWCNFLYRKAARIVVLSPGFRGILKARGVPESKIDVVYNWCDEDQIIPADRDESLALDLGMAGRFNVVFAGNIGKAQALDAVIEAAANIETPYPDIQFIFVGDGIDVERLKDRTKNKGLANVKFLGRYPITQISKILSLSDVLLVHLKDTPLFSITIPSKTQAYMYVGRPILMATCGDAADLVARAKAGISCDPENADKIANSIKYLHDLPRPELEAMGINGRRFYDRELSLAKGAQLFEKAFRRVSETS